MAEKENETHGERKIEFKDLSTKLKIAIVMAWVVGGISIISFVGAFLSALWE